jgi:hypothetical protein
MILPKRVVGTTHSAMAELLVIPKLNQLLLLALYPSPLINLLDDQDVPCSSSGLLWEVSPIGDKGVNLLHYFVWDGVLQSEGEVSLCLIRILVEL